MGSEKCEKMGYNKVKRWVLTMIQRWEVKKVMQWEFSKVKIRVLTAIKAIRSDEGKAIGSEERRLFCAWLCGLRQKVRSLRWIRSVRSELLSALGGLHVEGSSPTWNLCSNSAFVPEPRKTTENYDRLRRPQNSSIGSPYLFRYYRLVLRDFYFMCISLNEQEQFWATHLGRVNTHKFYIASSIFTWLATITFNYFLK
jgi:hypothetical protein